MKIYLTRLFSVLIVVCIAVNFSSGQAESINGTKAFNKKRFYFGGNGGLNFGTVTYIEIAPIVGYRITDRYSAGVGLKYIYESIKLRQVINQPNLKFHYYGGSIFNRYFLLKNVFLHAEYETINYPTDPYLRNLYNLEKRQWSSALLVGGGFRQMISEHSSFTLMALYDILQSPNSPYPNPLIFRAGFNIGL